MGAGWKAFCANRSITEESLPMEYSMTGFSNSSRHLAEDVDALRLQYLEMG